MPQPPFPDVTILTQALQGSGYRLAPVNRDSLIAAWDTFRQVFQCGSADDDLTQSVIDLIELNVKFATCVDIVTPGQVAHQVRDLPPDQVEEFNLGLAAALLGILLADVEPSQVRLLHESLLREESDIPAGLHDMVAYLWAYTGRMSKPGILLLCRVLGQLDIPHSQN